LNGARDFVSPDFGNEERFWFRFLGENETRSPFCRIGQPSGGFRKRVVYVYNSSYALPGLVIVGLRHRLSTLRPSGASGGGKFAFEIHLTPLRGLLLWVCGIGYQPYAPPGLPEAGSLRLKSTLRPSGACYCGDTASAINLTPLRGFLMWVFAFSIHLRLPTLTGQASGDYNCGV
jgi:hypothetical protein